MAVILSPGYPQSVGGKTVAIGQTTGVNYTAGTAQTLSATAFGMRYITHVTGGMSESGTYVTVGKVVGAGGKTTAGLHWFTSNNGSEATADVSAEKVLIRVEGF